MATSIKLKLLAVLITIVTAIPVIFVIFLISGKAKDIRQTISPPHQYLGCYYGQGIKFRIDNNMLNYGESNFQIDKFSMAKGTVFVHFIEPITYDAAGRKFVIVKDRNFSGIFAANGNSVTLTFMSAYGDLRRNFAFDKVGCDNEN